MARYASNLGSDSNPGTQAQPVLTIGKAIALVREDQKTDRRLGVVNVEPGDYSEAIALSDDITIQRSDGKPAQTVDVENGMYTGGPAKQVRLVRATVGGPLITVGSAQRVTLRGLVIDGKNLGGRGLDADGAKDLSIDSCQFINHVTNVVYKGREKGSLDDPYLGDRSVTIALALGSGSCAPAASYRSRHLCFQAIAAIASFRFQVHLMMMTLINPTRYRMVCHFPARA